MSANPSPAAATSANRLVSQVICPHCWHRFVPEDVLWIAEHIELFGDNLVANEYQRFLPSRFTPQGDAIDAQGLVCRALACPQCHLSITRGLLESDPLFLSMIGGPASGKSYFLTAASWKLREVLTESFGVKFQDADPAANLALNAAEGNLFHNPKPNHIHLPTKLIDKTELEGNTYDTITYGQHHVTYPRPYLFSLQLHERHPLAAKKGLDYMLCLYDNAGEHWTPGTDKPTAPLTRHLEHSRVLLYLFDPTQHPRFNDTARQSNPSGPAGSDRITRQETILNEAAARIRKYCGLASNARIDRPLIVVLPKFDAWSHLLDDPPQEEPWRFSQRHSIAGFLTDQVDGVSKQLQELLRRLCPELVNAAESLSSKVIYIPVSAAGEKGMVLDPETGKWGIRPSSVKPFWVTVPFLYALQIAAQGLIPRVVMKSTSDTRSLTS